MNNPVVCPLCETPACKNCLENSVNILHQCPMCKGNINVGDLKTMLILQNDFSSFTSNVTPTSNFENIIKCEEHGEPKEYFCFKCAVSLCRHCVVLNKTHSDHQIVVISNVYKKEYDSINQQIQKKKDEIESNKKEIKECSDLINKVKEGIETVYKKIGTAIKESLNHKIRGIEREIKSLNNDLNSKETEMEREISAKKTEMNSCTKEDFIMISGIYKEDINNIDTTLNKRYILNNSKYELNSSEVANYIPTFRSKEIEVDAYKEGESDTFILYGLKWKIIYQSEGERDNQFIAVFLHLVDTILHPLPIEFEIELLNIKGFANFSDEIHFVFGEIKLYGFTKFYERSKLQEKGFINDAGKLKIKISIKPTTYGNLIFSTVEE
ncbi:MAG: hypothetical protein MJ252_18465 [archaeon]|nr:hypothetical protein [archaeon]